MTLESVPTKRSVVSRLLAVGAIIVVVVGFWGFRLANPNAPESEHFYRSLQLFVFESGDLSGTVPWQLEVARLAAPALTVASAVAAAAAVTRNRFDRCRARTRRGHVVVCGLGERGAVAALALQHAGHRVVGIDVDMTGSGVTLCRRERIPVINGDGRDPRVLAAARVGSAAHLLILTPSLGRCGEIAMAATTVVAAGRPTPLGIHLEIDDPRLAALLHALEIDDSVARGWRLEELDLAGVAARAMLDEQPPWPATDVGAHLVVAGATALGVTVAEEAARRWMRDGGPAGGLVITMFDPDAAARHRLPMALHGAQLQWHETSPELPGATPLVAALATAEPPVTASYVCITDEPTALSAALAITNRVPGSPVVVSLTKTIALAEMLRSNAPQLRPVALADCALSPFVLLDSTVERTARALHDSYRQRAPAGEPAAVAWEHLAEPLKASNRAHARHLAEKVRSVAMVLAPDDGSPADAFSEDEIETLGRLEHDRWVAERIAAGWTSGPRDPTAKTTPYLVGWDDLADDVRDLDRSFVRAIPTVLADAGLILRRVTPTARSTGGRLS